jgi:hypothetical protein
MGNASLFPFAVAGILVLGVLLGLRLPAAQRDATLRIFAIVATVAAIAALLWLALRIHNLRPRSFAFLCAGRDHGAFSWRLAA